MLAGQPSFFFVVAGGLTSACHRSDKPDTKEMEWRGTITRGGAEATAAWEDPACRPRGKHPAAGGGTGKQMGHREKRISVWSDIRRSLRPITAAQEVGDGLRLMAPGGCLAALNEWGGENGATEQHKHSVPAVSHPPGGKCPLCSSFQCAALCASVSVRALESV